MDAGGSPDRGFRAAAYAVVRRGASILLVRASGHSGRPGVWWLPGGGLDFGEHPADCVLRELAEETGLEGRVVSLIDVISDVGRVADTGGQRHTIRILYAVEVVGGTLTPESAGTTDRPEWVDVRRAGELPLVPFVRALVDEQLGTTSSADR